jgi:hypothetical protein
MADIRDKYVCPGCITEPILAEAVRQQADDEACSYCGASPAAPIDVVIDAVTEVLEFEYTDPANELPYESREGGYQGTVYDGDELVYDMTPWTENEALLEDVAYDLGGTAWCQRDYFSLNDLEQLNFGWRDFVKQIKHHTRYLFLEELGTGEVPEVDGIPPGRMLAVLGKLFREHELFRILPAGTALIRTRVVDEGEAPDNAQALGSPPRDKARSNRMSPAGIPMFYAAFDAETAVLETYDPTRGHGKRIVLATFLAAKDLLLLNLTEIPTPPSRFDVDHRHTIPALAFLHDFAEELAKPVARDALEHVDYVPTQVVTEYVRHRLTTHDNQQPVGILYRSSRPGGGLAVVLFAEPEHCGPRDSEPPLRNEFMVTLADVRVAEPDDFKHLWRAS